MGAIYIDPVIERATVIAMNASSATPASTG